MAQIRKFVPEIARLSALAAACHDRRRRIHPAARPPAPAGRQACAPLPWPRGRRGDPFRRKRTDQKPALRWEPHWPRRFDGKAALEPRSLWWSARPPRGGQNAAGPHWLQGHAGRARPPSLYPARRCHARGGAGRTVLGRARHRRRQGVPRALRWRSPSVSLHRLARGGLGIWRSQALYPPADDPDGRGSRHPGSTGSRSTISTPLIRTVTSCSAGSTTPGRI